MAFFRCSSGSGGSETETTLWTNPDTTAGFSAQEVTLSSAYTNYKKIRFYYYSVYSASTVSGESCVDYKKEEIDKWERYGSATNGSMFGSFSQYQGSGFYSRPIARAASGDDKFYFYLGQRLNGTGTGSHVCKPVKITGIS